MAMANKKITEVDFAGALNGNESFFINQNNILKQVKRDKIMIDIANGGTGSTTGEEAIQNFLASGNMILSPYQYGDTLPEAGVKGRVFFKKLSVR